MPYFLLRTGAAAERHIAAADDRVTANIVVGFDDNDRSAFIARFDRPPAPSTDHHDIGFEIPAILCCLCHRTILRSKVAKFGFSSIQSTVKNYKSKPEGGSTISKAVRVSALAI